MHYIQSLRAKCKQNYITYVNGNNLFMVVVQSIIGQRNEEIRTDG